MPEEDRLRWNARYREQGPCRQEPHPFVVEVVEGLSPWGEALDVAGGPGRHALWLAQRGWKVTLTDLSDEALRLAAQRAHAEKLRIQVVQRDLEQEGIPEGPWALIVCTFFLHRPLFEQFARHLAPGGHLVVVHPTWSNLQRHARPPGRYLLQDGELPGLCRGLCVLHYEEGWFATGYHEARLWAQRPRTPQPTLPSDG